jgi:hypothetical protein
VETQRHTIDGLIPAIERWNHVGSVNEIRARPVCVNLDRDLWRKLVEQLMRPESDAGGRPSIGPRPPPSSGSTGCNVTLASAVGTGFRHAAELRGITSKRGIGCENGVHPKCGLRGVPVGMAAELLATNGFSPRIGAASRRQ